MIGHWTRSSPDTPPPAEGEALLFLRVGTPIVLSVPVLPYEKLLGEKAEIVPALFLNGFLVEQNGYRNVFQDGIWWTSMPPLPDKTDGGE